MLRKIIHLDMDCFFAAIEMRDNPTLTKKPIAVGGGNRRGVVTTCNYIARRFGVCSAMSGQRAKQLCPQIIFLPVNIEKYKETSRKIREILRKVTASIIEPLSLDEAYLDVTDCPLYNNSATYIARYLKEIIYQETLLTSSAGVAPNKFLAKIASDWHKPDGLKVIEPHAVADFIYNVPVAKIPGVGKVTQRKLARLDIRTCRDVQATSPELLTQILGKFATILIERSFGRDERAIQPQRIRKSLSVESTFMDDIDDDNLCLIQLRKLWSELANRLRKKAINRAIKGIFVKIKFADFVSTTKQSLTSEISCDQFVSLYREARSRRRMPLRLLGLGVYFLLPPQKSRSHHEQIKKGENFDFDF